MTLSLELLGMEGFDLGTAERRKREKQRRQKAILDAAEEIFLRKSLENITMDEIAAQAELAKGTLYLYFDSKDQILMALTLRALNKLNDIVQEKLKTCTNAWEKILAALEGYRDFYHQYPDHFTLFFQWDNIQVDPQKVKQQDTLESDYFRATNWMFVQFKEFVDEGIESGVIKPIADPQKILMTISGVIQGYLRIYITRKDLIELRFGYDFDEFLEGLKALLESALRREEITNP
jgi:TetR/AcrR family transcriptional regulator